MFTVITITAAIGAEAAIIKFPLFEVSTRSAMAPFG